MCLQRWLLIHINACTVASKDTLPPFPLYHRCSRLVSDKVGHKGLCWQGRFPQRDQFPGRGPPLHPMTKSLGSVGFPSGQGICQVMVQGSSIVAAPPLFLLHWPQAKIDECRNEKRKSLFGCVVPVQGFGQNQDGTTQMWHCRCMYK